MKARIRRASPYLRRRGLAPIFCECGRQKLSQDEAKRVAKSWRRRDVVAYACPLFRRSAPWHVGVRR